MIEINNLSFGYKKSKLLYDGLTTNLEGGNIYGLLGKNGAGKSTLLKLITGIIFPIKGEVKVYGKDPKKRLPSFLSNIYFIPEEVDVPPISIQKYIKLFSPFYPNFNQNQLYTYLDEFEVNYNGKLSDLSFGQQKKFIIAFSLACNTDLLIMDEPTNGLDIPSKSWFRKLISLALNDSRVVIISTHQVRDLDNLIDAVLIMDQGKLLLKKTLIEISEKLSFKNLNNVSDEAEYLICEKNIEGYSVLMENKNHDDTKVNLEHLFEACIKAPQRITSIFNH